MASVYSANTRTALVTSADVALASALNPSAHGDNINHSPCTALLHAFQACGTSIAASHRARCIASPGALYRHAVWHLGIRINDPATTAVYSGRFRPRC
jgi:hypothetical protein